MLHVQNKDSVILMMIKFMKNYFTLLLFIFIIFMLSFSSANAISLDKASYEQGEEITVSDMTALPIIYNLDSEAYIFESQDYDPNWNINWLSLNVGSYVLMEMSYFIGCSSQSLSHSDCIADVAFINEFSFSIIPPPSSYSGSDELDAPPPGKTTYSYQPQIEISSPNSRNAFSSKIPIIYSATDQNDTISVSSRDLFGLGDYPVSLYFTDKFTRMYELDDSSNDRTLIKNGLPPVGTYDWEANTLLEQKFYQVIARVVDKAGLISQTITDLFSIDATAPTFIVTANPPVAKNEKVTINIKSSEKLIKLPIVSVLQRGALPVNLKVVGDLNSYTATYDTIDGFDGTAIVKVSGVDMAGNFGNVIVGGGTFSVGINPPSNPIVTDPKNNSKNLKEVIDIVGTGRDDTIITVTVNGKESYTAKPDSVGNFIIKNVRLNKKNINGKNVLNITAKDTFGSVSSGVVYNVYSNDNPGVVLNTPIDKSLLNGMSSISATGVDSNGDKINYKYEIAPKDKNVANLIWQLIENVPSDKISFNTTKFADGDYYLRVTADDGLSSSLSNIVSVNIKNETSFFIRFYDGYRTITNNTKATVRGVIFTDKSVYPIPSIKSLYYSMDNGVKWIKVSALDGSFDSKEERFSAELSDLKPGINHTLWHVVDSRGKFYDTEQMVVVDNVPPISPEIITPDFNNTLTKNDNDLTDTAKFNFTVSGNSESDSSVVVEIAGKSYSTRTAYDGTFRITGINLPKVGKYNLKIFAIDAALNKSKVIDKTIIYNNAPIVVFTSPREGRGVGLHTDITWLVNDIDKDKIINTTLSYHQIGSPYIVLAQNTAVNKYSWDTSNLSGSNFEIKLEVSDEFSKSTNIIPFSIDHNIPQILSFELSQSSILTGGLFEANGKAEDKDSGVEFVEYSFVPVSDISIKTNPTWYKAVINNKSLSNSVFFTIKNHINLPDGHYQVSIRAVDAAGNISDKKYQNITIDNTPPHIGTFEVVNEGVKLLPKNEVWTVINNTNIKLNVSLENDTKVASIKNNGVETILVRDTATGLWNGEIYFNNTGSADILISATDILGNNIKDKQLVNFQVLPKSRITYKDENGVEIPIIGANIKANITEEKHSFWSLFSSDKIIDTTTDINGEYVLLLPAGSYDLSIVRDGFQTLKLGNLTFDNQTFYTQPNILIKENKKNNLWSKFIHMIQFN